MLYITNRVCRLADLGNFRKTIYDRHRFSGTVLTALRFGATLGLIFLASSIQLPLLGNDDDATTSVPAADKPIAVEIQSQEVATQADPIQLSYKFQAGQFVYYVGTSRVEYIQQVENEKTGELSTYKSTQSNETGSHFRVVTVDEKGNALIEPVVDRTRMTAQMPNKEPVVFDSKDTTAYVLPEFRPIQDSIGRPVARFMVSPNGELLKSVIVDVNTPPSLRESAEKLTTRFPFLPRLSKDPIKVGTVWRENYYTWVSVRNGFKEAVPIRRFYEITGVSDGIAQIKFRTVLLKSLNDPEQEAQVMQQTPQGTIEFDVQQGVVASVVSRVNQTTVNAFGPKTVMQIIGESTEKLIPASEATKLSAK